MRGDACALLGDGFLGNLHEDLLAGLKEFVDGWEVGRLHGGAATTAVTASTRAVAVGASAGVARAVSTIRTAKAASVTTAIAATTATIAAAVAPGDSSGGAILCLIDTSGDAFAAFSK